MKCVHQTHQQLSNCKGCSDAAAEAEGFNETAEAERFNELIKSDNLSRTCESELMSSD
jgi:hypothetical protein